MQLRQQAAEAFQKSASAEVRVSGFREQILNRAGQNRQLIQRGYKAGEVGFLDWLTVQRTFLVVNLKYIRVLGDLATARQQLAGMMLMDP